MSTPPDQVWLARGPARADSTPPRGSAVEAVLQQGGPWDEVDRILSGALDVINDFVGHRPVAVLEKNGPTAGIQHDAPPGRAR